MRVLALRHTATLSVIGGKYIALDNPDGSIELGQHSGSK
jgi:hypothetical protein